MQLQKCLVISLGKKKFSVTINCFFISPDKTSLALKNVENVVIKVCLKGPEK